MLQAPGCLSGSARAANIASTHFHGQALTVRRTAVRCDSRNQHICKPTAGKWNWGPLEWARASDENDKDEAYRIQQEVLKRRRNKSWEAPVLERRAEVRKYNTDKEYRDKVNADKRTRFEKKKADRAEATKGGIPFPMASFGLPDYDQGERFDLKGPYVDSGWVDEDADFFKQIGKLFGRKGKSSDEGDNKSKPGKK